MRWDFLLRADIIQNDGGCTVEVGWLPQDGKREGENPRWRCHWVQKRMGAFEPSSSGEMGWSGFRVLFEGRPHQTCLSMGCVMGEVRGIKNDSKFCLEKWAKQEIPGKQVWNPKVCFWKPATERLSMTHMEMSSRPIIFLCPPIEMHQWMCPTNKKIK